MKTEKVKVINPISRYNTVGKELEIILHNKGIGNIGSLTKSLNLRSPLCDVAKLTKSQRKTIERFVKIEGFGDFLERFQEDYKQTKVKTDDIFKQYKKAYIKLNKVKDYLSYYAFNGSDLLEDIVQLLGIDDELDDNAVSNAMPCVAVNFRKPTKNTDPLMVLAFLRKGEIDFEIESNKGLPKYDKISFLKWLSSGSTWRYNLDSNEFVVNKLAAELRQFGIVLSLAKALPKSVYGATRWIDGNPLIQVSDREKNLSVFWYTLFHEFGHMVEHEGSEMINEEGGLSRKNTQKREKEANEFADRYLCNGLDVNNYIQGAKRQQTIVDVHELATSYKIHPMFILYRMNKAQYFKSEKDKSNYNRLRFTLDI